LDAFHRAVYLLSLKDFQLQLEDFEKLCEIPSITYLLSGVYRSAAVAMATLPSLLLLSLSPVALIS